MFEAFRFRFWNLFRISSFLLGISAGLARCAEVRFASDPATLCEGRARAGCPQVVSPCARPSDTPNYGGYYVGGGAAVQGQPRYPCEGTWGWDYFGFVPKRIELFWWHGARRQGGGGSYATDHK